MRRLMYSIIAYVTLWVAPCVAADIPPSYFAYFPGSPLSLGAGFVQNDLAKSFASCVTGSPEDASPGTGALYSKAEFLMVRDYSSLMEAMGFDVRIKESGFYDQDFYATDAGCAAK